MREIRRFNAHRTIPLAHLCLVLMIMIGGMLLRASPSVVLAQGHLARRSHSSSQRLPGHIVPLLKNVKPIAPAPQDMRLHLSVALQLRNQETLDDLLAAQQDPTSPLYHRYLTPQEFTSQFAPTQQEVDAVTAYLSQQKLQVTSVASNHVLIDVSANVATTEQAFAITLNDYKLKNRVVYAPNTDPLVPENLVNTIATISGLNNVSIYRPLGLQHRHRHPSHQFGPNGGLTPDELRTAYDVQPLLKTGADGTRQTIALFELDGYTPTDIDTYLHQYKLGAPKYSNVLVDGVSNTAGSDALEVELDMETASAMAPGARQQVYIGPNTPAGVNDVYNKIVTDDVARVVSISWGSCELASVLSRLDALDAIFKQGAAQGQAFFAASGDSGAYDCGDNNLAVDSPASDPYVVGVGGTMLKTGTGGIYQSESAWGSSGELGGGSTNEGGGGGKSIHFLRPDYQSGPNLTDTYRMVPDVSADADPASGYSVYSTVSMASQVPKVTAKAGWLNVGGTSAAAPLWAGIAADINQFLEAERQTGLGNALPVLYQLYNTPQIYPPYHDVTTGSNRYYQAGPGYDLATGMGTPDAWNMARDLLSAAGMPTQLINNSGFEDGPNTWQETSSGGFELVTTTNPHTGKYSAYLCGYMHCDDRIAQTVFLPLASQKITLSYWLYIGRGDPTTTCQDTVQISLRTAKGAPISTVQKLCNTDANGWMQYTFNLTTALTPYLGQLIQVVFEAKGVSGQKANFFVDVDDVALLALGSSRGTTIQLFKNQSFEDGRDSWQETSSGGYEIISTAIPHTGKYSAYLCGYTHCDDTISQEVALPASIQKVTLSYWVYIGRADPTTNCQDTFHAYLRTAKGTPIATVQRLCNTDANGWTQYTFDLTAALATYHGQAVQVVFEAVGIGGQRANFFVDVDDVALLVTHL